MHFSQQFMKKNNKNWCVANTINNIIIMIDSYHKRIIIYKITRLCLF